MIVKKSFTPELFKERKWEGLSKEGDALADGFIERHRFFYRYADGSDDYYSVTLARAAVEIELEYKLLPQEVVRIVTYRFFLETNGKLRMWCSDWQVTPAMLEVAPYFKSWATPEQTVYVQAVGNYVNKP